MWETEEGSSYVVHVAQFLKLKTTTIRVSCFLVARIIGYRTCVT
jgi:hypothetical protein